MKTGQWDSGRFRTGKKEKKAKRGRVQWSTVAPLMVAKEIMRR